MSGLITIAPGTLPTASAIYTRCRELGVAPDATLRTLRALLRHGHAEQARALLNTLGFTWSEPSVSDLDLDVAAVAEALEHKQWRCVFSRADGRNGCVFIDAEDEAGARAFFATVFPGATLTSVTLEPVDVCSRYERRAT